MGGSNRRDFAILLSLLALVLGVFTMFGLLGYAAWVYLFSWGD